MNVGGRLKATSVRDICSARKTEFKRTLTILRAQIDTQMMEAAGQGRPFVLIDVPRHYIGREPYDWVQMGKSIIESLLEDGFYVAGTYIRFKLSWETPIVSKKQPMTKQKPFISIPLVKRC